MVLSSFSVDGSALIWNGDGEILRLDPWGVNSVRVRASKNNSVEDVQWGLLPLAKIPSEASATITIAADGASAEMIVGELTVKCEATEYENSCAGCVDSRCSLSFWNARGKLLLKEISAGGSLKLHARSYLPISGNSFGITASFKSPSEEHLYGMGEYQQDCIDLKGCTFELAHRNSQASIPFVVSSAGYGFLWNNPAVGSACFAKNRTEWRAQSATQLDYWVTAGNTPRQIESQYANVTGYAPVMPEWGLGFWQCKLRYWNQEQLLEVARGFRQRSIPLDVIVVDFFHWPHLGDFCFDKEFWPDPKAMCDELHEMGIKVMVSVWPQVALKSSNYAYMRANNLLVRAEQGIDVNVMFEEPSQSFDATNPDARKFVWDQCRRNYTDYGVDAFWLDEAEPEYGTYDFSNYRYWAGANQQIGNIYPVEYNKAFYEGQLEIGRHDNIVNLTRCAWVGAQRYGALVWSGDVASTFEAFKAQITCAIHMGMSGIPWFTTDLGGFHDGEINDPSFRELLMRWCAFSCFSPVMRNHGNRSLSQPDGAEKEIIRSRDGRVMSPSGADNEPWSYGTEVEKVFRKYISIRESLRPYLREIFNEAHHDGHPLMRGLFYEFPNDAKAFCISDEYMFGPDFLVAPIVKEGATARTVYLPGDDSTQWVDVNSGESYSGGRTVAVDAPVDVIPLFARNGKDHGLRNVISAFADSRRH
ncbi:TIM-barrel domain-containing protein [Bifidobacterium aerophilum]|uniref:Family 31 glucosidase n=1 Tax=Bifidobacterium aerophilum TaxID=1798155 RepID=A0A6N9Z5M6_9BIFI|nr:glycoside hydrolase family 31 protein [Bifidobacterium aerophilum]NEG90017.1 family 31 glucosidase [Bifidobacterium aerophilum]